MEVSKVSFEGFRCPRRMTMTPTKKKVHAKNIVINSANESKRSLAKWLNSFQANQCVNFCKSI